ncbi:hypothetical protein [Pedobacter sp. Leaf132]|uniref:hypothetical protein n=1 Tax=Pedobacter sp. Leaf132 TaxID=2876557 RepID=UPI001E2E91A5|nr:hypothetical protein [Pedobacter sp. Leaf132]
MGLVPQFTKADIAKAIKSKVEAYQSAIKNRFQYVGEQFINLARKNNTYVDQTGNLRSSIGYMVFYNGQVISQNFDGKDKGKVEGKRIANLIAEGHPKGFILVAVAGMDYAVAVEARGKDVITNSSKTTRELLIRALDKLNRQYRGK